DNPLVKLARDDGRAGTSLFGIPATNRATQRSRRSTALPLTRAPTSIWQRWAEIVLAAIELCSDVRYMDGVNDVHKNRRSA
ncbi:MAG: hypothetical protein ABL908_22905, partial [Hyphomicrobium sp.]